MATAQAAMSEYERIIGIYTQELLDKKANQINDPKAK
jgi:hypothetical protein